MNKRTASTVASLLMAFSLSSADAGSIYFSDPSPDLVPGAVFTLDLMADFTSEATLGGGIDFFFDDSIIAFQSFTFATTTLSLDPDFGRLPDVLSGELEGLAFGNFAGIGTAGRVGTFTFEALTAGSMTLTADTTSDPLKGGAFISDVTFSEQAMTFGNVTVAVNAVPVPAAVWLFGSGLLGLVGVARRAK